MNKVRQHVPAFIDIEPVGWTEFSSTKELFEIDFIKRHIKPNVTFAQSSETLMIILDAGPTFFVLGYLEHPIKGLPEWEYGKRGIDVNTLLK